MKGFIILLWVIVPQIVLAQKDSIPESLDKLGWTLLNFEQPEKITELDSGRATYLITLNKNGYVKSIELLRSTFRVEAEREWRKIIERYEFEQKESFSGQPPKYKGTLFIECKSGRDY